MSVLYMFVFCFFFTSLVLTVVYLAAFRKPTHKHPLNMAVWDYRNKNLDLKNLGIKNNQRLGKRKKDYFVFYDPKTQSRGLLNIRVDSDYLLHRQRIHNDIRLIKLSSCIGLIFLFSLIIILAVKTGEWLYQIYSWLQ